MVNTPAPNTPSKHSPFVPFTFLFENTHAEVAKRHPQAATKHA